MSQERDECCATCKFWCRVDEEANVGWCRRHPPVHLPAVVQLWVARSQEEHEAKTGKSINNSEFVRLIRDSVDNSFAWEQPVTVRDEWCGEYEPHSPNENKPTPPEPQDEELHDAIVSFVAAWQDQSLSPQEQLKNAEQFRALMVDNPSLSDEHWLLIPTSMRASTLCCLSAVVATEHAIQIREAKKK